MVSPAATNFEVALAITFLDEATRTHQRDGRNIPWLDVCFETMQLQLLERELDALAQRFLHQTAAFIPRKCVVAEIATSKGIVNDVGNFDEANQPVQRLSGERRTQHSLSHSFASPKHGTLLRLAVERPMDDVGRDCAEPPVRMLSHRWRHAATEQLGISRGAVHQRTRKRWHGRIKYAAYPPCPR